MAYIILFFLVSSVRARKETKFTLHHILSFTNIVELNLVFEKINSNICYYTRQSEVMPNGSFWTAFRRPKASLTEPTAGQTAKGWAGLLK